MKQNNCLSTFLNGLIKENPVLVLVLGTCPTLATTRSLTDAFGMGIDAMIVLICSNVIISLLRKVIPDNVRIPCYIVVIAGFVTIVEMIVHAKFEELYNKLPLISKKDLVSIGKLISHYFGALITNNELLSVNDPPKNAISTSSAVGSTVSSAFSMIDGTTSGSKDILPEILL